MTAYILSLVAMVVPLEIWDMRGSWAETAEELAAECAHVTVGPAAQSRARDGLYHHSRRRRLPGARILAGRREDALSKCICFYAVQHVSRF